MKQSNKHRIKFAEDTKLATIELLQSDTSPADIIDEVTEYCTTQLSVISNFFGEEEDFRDYLDSVIDSVLQKRGYVSNILKGAEMIIKR